MGKKEDKIESIAEAAYGVVRFYCQILGDDDYPFPGWADAPDSIRQSCIESVKDQSLPGGSTLTSKQQHNLWLDSHEAAGWKYGLNKDPIKKEHPCMVPYEFLPSKFRAKSDVFSAAVRGLLGL